MKNLFLLFTLPVMLLWNLAHLQTLDDYISEVKCEHKDDYGNIGVNENTTPNSSYKYVKPYQPFTPIVDNPTTTTVDITVRKHPSEAEGLEYCIYESSTTQHVQDDGSLGSGPIYQTRADWGTITVTGLSLPLGKYYFQTKSMNEYDSSTESEYSIAVKAGEYWLQTTDTDFYAGEFSSTTVESTEEPAYNPCIKWSRSRLVRILSFRRRGLGIQESN